MPNLNVISILKDERTKMDLYVKQHYKNFALYVTLLTIDIMVIIFINAATITMYAWFGLFGLLVLAAIEIKQSMEFRELRNGIDRWYFQRELEASKKSL